MKKTSTVLLISTLLRIVAFSQESEQTTPTPEQYRAMIAQSIADLNVPADVVSETKDIIISDSIHLRIYYPLAEGPLPILFQMHGGCWVAGDLETHDNICRYLCKQAECIVVAIDYRQPPENKYPTAVNDCYTALQWIYNNAEAIGGDKCRIGLIGDSSGGNLASAVCLKNRAEGNGVPILIQVLVNPVLDLRENSSSFNTYMGCVFAYLNDMQESTEIYASPLAAEKFNDLPSALIITSENDESKDEAQLYHTQLLKAGVESSLFEIKGIGHFAGLWAAGSGEVQEAKVIVAQQLKELF